MEFRDISSETQRTYTFPGGDAVTIEAPVKLHVSASQTHRIVDAKGGSHIIPWGWIHLAFTVKPGSEPFSF